MRTLEQQAICVVARMVKAMHFNGEVYASALSAARAALIADFPEEALAEIDDAIEDAARALCVRAD